MSKKLVMKLASRGKRFGAYCIDKSILWLLIMLATANNTKLGWGQSYSYNYGYGVEPDFGTDIIGAIAAFLIIFIISVAYAAVQLVFYSKSKTIGKAIFGMQVISSIDGQPIGFGKMILREWFAKKASAAAFLLGYIWVLIDDKNRGWHDKIMDTYVIDIDESAKLGSVNPQSADAVITEEKMAATILEKEATAIEKSLAVPPIGTASEEDVDEKIKSIVEEPEIEIKGIDE